MGNRAEPHLNRLIKLLATVTISLGTTAASIYMLTAMNWADDPERAAALSGWVGMNLGYWLR